MKGLVNILTILLTLLLITGCGSYSKVSNQNLYFSYRKEFNTIHPSYTLFHESDTVSTVHYTFGWNEFLFIKTLGDTNFRSSAKIAYRLLKDYESKDLLDSGSVSLSATSPSSSSETMETGRFPVKAKGIKNALLEITLTDLRRNQFARQYISFDKGSVSARQNFLVTQDGKVLMNYHLNKADTLKLRHASEDVRRLYVRYYNRSFPIAAPPFSDYLSKAFEYNADSLFQLTADSSGIFTITLHRNGFYHFQHDTAQRHGLTLFRFHEDFPKVSSPEELIKPLRYITSKKEYDDMLHAGNSKAAIDQFWLNNAGSSLRAKELIRTYYNRVQDANRYFTSYLEGWKSDRGLIYIIYGPPTAVYRTNNSESWVFGEENNIRSLHFTFVKVINPFTENDYSLIRNENYKDSWYVAVDTWRQGRVFAD